MANYYRCIWSIFLLLLQLSGVSATAQPHHYLPDNQPEQDACGAISICSDSISMPYSYHGFGLIYDASGENNSVWFKIQIAAGGRLHYKLKPFNPQDTYSAFVYHPTTGNCQNVGSPIRSGLVLLPNNLIPMRADIDATTGDIYYIMVQGYGKQKGTFVWDPPVGFVLDFSGSTATFVKGNPPVINTIERQCANKSRILVDLSKIVKCSSIDQDGSSLEVLSSGFPLTPGVIYSVRGVGCPTDGTGFAQQLKVSFGYDLAPGAYFLRVKNGTDGNSFLDMCDEPVPLPFATNFLVPDLNDTIDLTICPSQMPYLWNGLSITDSGAHVAVYKSENYFGCDSSTVLNLSLTDTLRDSVNLWICSGTLPLLWNNIVVTDTGTNVANYYSSSSGGCDSLTTLNLHIITPKEDTINASSCGPYTYKGQVYTHAQLIVDTIKSTRNCDSIYLLIDLSVYPELIPDTVEIDSAGCGFVLFKDHVYTHNQQLQDTLLNGVGCDSIYRTINIIVYPNTQPIKYYDTVAGCNEVTFEGINYTRDTVLVKVLQNIAGCDSAARITVIKIHSLSLRIIANPPVPVKGDMLTLTALGDMPGVFITSWHPSILFKDQHAPQQHLFLLQATTFSVAGVGPNGCKDSIHLYIEPDSLIPRVVIPNAFTPNGDGLNDYFSLNFLNKSGHVISQIRIVDRWGKTVYKNYNKKEIYWNGTIGWERKPAPSGTYFYYVDITYLDGTREHLSGAIHLLR